MILLYITYMSFYLISIISLSLLLFKVNFSLAVLTVGFSVLAYITKIVGEYTLLKEREIFYAKLQKEAEEKEQEMSVVYTGKGSN